MKHTTTTLFLAVTLCASALVTPVARAQYFAPISNTTFQPFQIYAPLPITQSVTQDVERESKNIGGKSSSHSVGGTAPKKALTTTTYRESPTVHKQILGKFTRYLKTRVTSKADAESLCRDFESKDVMAAWAKEEVKQGLQRGDVADAMAYYWVTDWQIANRVTSDPTRAQVRAVRRFFASTLASTPAFAKSTSAQRQEMAEGYIYTAVLQGGVFAQVFHTGNKALIQKVSDGQAAQFKTETGLDLRLMKLTNAGFAAKA